MKLMTNPAPYYVEEKVITIIDNKRIESYSPLFVQVMDMDVYGDVESTIYNSRTIPLRSLAGNPVIDAYIEEMDAVMEEAERKRQESYAKAGIVTYEALRKARNAR